MTNENVKSENQNVAGLHIPIMITEVINGFEIKPNDIVVDCTTNRGGHSIEFIRQLSEGGRLICIDLDSEALEEAKINLSDISKTKNIKIDFLNINFADISEGLQKVDINKVNIIFADLGFSSQELDISGRGFTFQKDEPLLMTFASGINDDTLTARDIVNKWGEDLIADILYNFADETYSRRIARKIVEVRKSRKIETTFDLVSIIKESTPTAYHNRRTHFATKTFQALRMATNKEVDNIIKLLENSKEILSVSGKIGFITFHSIEDRIVKKKANELGLKMVTKKPIEPGREEIKKNPRSRSSKLRIYELNIK